MMQRILIIDPAPASTRLLSDLLRDFANSQMWTATDTARGMGLAGHVNPHLIFVEQNAVVDGAAFTRKLRRSEISCRKAPVIMVTSEATAATILGARDSGVHEFLRKPYTAKDVLRRLEAVTLRGRDWVEAVNYIGPDRRRFNSGDYSGPLKRGTDTNETASETRILQALKILRAAIAAIEVDPKQALRAMLAQAAELQAVAIAVNDQKLAIAAGVLQRKLVNAGTRALVKEELQALLAELWTHAPDDKAKGSVAA